MTMRVLCWLGLLAACATEAPVPDEPRPVWPPPPDAPRVQFLMSISGSSEVESGPTALDRFLFGADAQVDTPILRPVAVAVRDGFVLALDSQLLAVHRIDLQNQHVDVVVPDGRGELRLPMDMCVAADGTAYIADRGRRQVLAFDRDWRLVREYGPWGQESAPVAVTAWRDRLFVADVAGRCVRVVDTASGESLATLSEIQGRPETALRAPTGLTVDDRGNVYVVDAIYQRVLVFDAAFAFVARLGEAGDTPGSFGRPKAAAVADRLLFVVDSMYENCQILDLDGKPLLFFGGGGTGPGDLYLPRGIWVGSDGLDLVKSRLDPGFVAEKLIAITSLYGSRKLSLYAFGRSTLPQFAEHYRDAEPSAAEPKPAATGR